MKLGEMLRFFKKYFKKEKKLFFKAIIFIFLSSIVSILYGYLMGVATDLITKSAFLKAILILSGLLIMGFVDSLILNRLGGIYLNKLSVNMMEKIGYEVYYKVGLLPARAFEEKSSGELINRITNDSSTISDAFRQLIHMLMSLWSTIVIFIYIFIKSKLIALEIIIYLTIFYFISRRYLPIIKKRQKEIQKEKDICTAEVNESIRGIREIRALGIRKKTNLNIKEIIQTIFNRSKWQMIHEKNYYALISCLNCILEVTVFISSIILICFNKSTFAFFISLTYYIYRFMNTVDLTMALSTTYQKMLVSIERIDEIINNKLYKDEEFGSVHNTDIKGKIEFKNVCFKYSNEDNNIFENLNFEIPANKNIAIVGKSGSGKTSIFNLLLRYFDVNSGVVLIDDVPIEDYDEDSLRKNIAIIRQNPFIFNKTILENLEIVGDKIPFRKIREACKLAQIDEYIMNLPNKYDTIIGEGGVNLSGGQKQRLAIARALLKESKIILFDEATSALDNENQDKIKEVIKDLSKDHTIIIVAHRLSTIIDTDEILLIDKGKIIAQGTHKELMKKNKMYKSLYKAESTK